MVRPRSIETCPSSGDSSPVIIRKIVDLPAPLGPTRPIFSPRKRAAEASTKRICGPCCLLIWSSRITGVAHSSKTAAAYRPRPAIVLRARPMDAAIRIENLVKNYADGGAVNGLDLEVRRGECFGLLGPNGAGKTTTVEILEGLVPATSGTVELLGRTWDRGPEGLRERIGVALQETRLFDRLTVEETMRLFRSFYSKGALPVETLLAEM